MLARIGSSVGAMTESRFVAIVPRPIGEWKSITDFVELSETGLSFSLFL